MMRRASLEDSHLHDDPPSATVSRGFFPTSMKWTAPSGNPERGTSKTPSATIEFNGLKEVPLGPRRQSSRQDLDSAVANDTEPAVKEFNGLKDVPLGPRMQSSRQDPDQAISSDVGPAVKGLPHIFIPARCLKPQLKTLKHLLGFLSGYIGHVSKIKIDQSGYYITFDDTERGLKLLHQCYREKNRQLLFSTYLLEMSCYPAGQKTSGDQTNDISTASNLDPPTTSVSEPGVRANPAAQDSIASELPSHDPATLPTVADVRPPDPRLRHLAPTSPTLISPRSPPLSSDRLVLPSRHDRDETSSSISGTTDMSASRIPTCHMCKTTPVAERDALVWCSSCPRRYHRRCHVNPRIPPNLDAGHSWQCRRCTKKQIRPRSRLSNTSPVPDPTPAPPASENVEMGSVLVETDPTLLYASLTSQVIEQPSTAMPEHRTMEPLNQRVDPIESRSLLANGLDLPTCETTGQVSHSAGNNNEADDLVDKSFDVTPVGVRKLSKPLLARRKIYGTMCHWSETSHALPSPQDLNPDRGDKLNGNEVDATAVSPIKKRHKWSGGGADKDIIKAAANAGFSSGQFSRDEPLSPADLPTPPSIDADASHCPKDVEDRSRQAQTALQAHDSPLESAEEETVPSMTASRLNDDNSARPDASIVQNDPKSHNAVAHGGVSTLKIKPSKTRISKCSKCNKSIAYVPSRSARLCTTCKGKPSISAEPGASDMASAAAFAEPVVTGAPGSVSGDTNGSESAASPLLHSAPKNVSPRPSASLPQGAAVPQVRKRVAVTFKTTAARKIIGTPVRSEEDSHDQDQQSPQEGAESDLDFWTSQAKASEQSTAGPHEDSSAAIVENDTLASSEKPPPEILSAQSTELVSTDTTRDQTLTKPSLTQTTDADMDESPKTTSKSSKKRHCYSVASTNPYDLGNSEQRPKGTYEKLIGMALLSNPGLHMSATEVCIWVTENIPGYTGEKVWQDGLRATISMHREGNTSKLHAPNTPLWKCQDKDARPMRWALMPGMEKKLMHWDPVLKEPRSPDDKWTTTKTKADVPASGSPIEHASDSDAVEDRMDIDPIGNTVSPGGVGSRRSKRMPIEDPDLHLVNGITSAKELSGQAIDTARSTQEQSVESDPSSDDEPIAHKRRKVPTPTQASFPNKPDNMDLDEGTNEESTGPVNAVEARSPVHPERPLLMRRDPPPPLDKPLSLAELIKKESENMDYSATFLFEEWPEYHPSYPSETFDRDAKMLEIKQRPNRKHRAKTAKYPWSDWKPLRLVDYNVPTGHATRTARKSASTVDPWGFPHDDRVKEFDTIQEMFGLPADPVAIISEGHIAFRDGTRNEDGSLPRARELFKTGYGGLG